MCSTALGPLFHSFIFFIFFYFLIFGFCLSRAALMAHGGSKAKGPIQAVAASLHHSHSNIRSKLHPQPTTQPMAMPDP